MRRRDVEGTADEEQRAHRLSDIVDNIVVRRRLTDASATSRQPDRELDHLAELAAELSAIALQPDEQVRKRLLRGLSEAAKARSRSSVFTSLAMLRAMTMGLKPASALAAVALAGLVLLSLRGSQASAAEILTRSDLAIAKLVQPGSMLFRRWRIVERIRDSPGAPERRVERYTFEWIDGSDIRHAVGKSISSTGHNYLAYVNVLDAGRYVPRVYYDPGFANEPDGLLSIVPSRQEFEASAARFTGNERRVVETYLARAYIYEPIVSERRFNDAMLTSVAGPEPLPHVLLAVDDSALLNGVPVYRVHSMEAVRLPFRWRSSGPPEMWLEQQATVRYIAKDSFLTLRAEEEIDAENGRHVQIVRELVETVTLPMPARDDESNPFNLENASQVPLRRQSAFEHLSQVIRTLRRAPAFLERHRDTLTEEH
jgi:hypothetical protein